MSYYSMPDAVMQTLLNCAERAREIHVVTPVVVTGVAEAFYECVRTGDDYSLEMVVPSEVFERVNAMFPTLTSELMGIRTCICAVPRFRSASGSGSLIRRKQASSSSPSKGIRGILMNDTDDALTWATNQYERAKQDADPIFLRGGSDPTLRQ